MVTQARLEQLSAFPCSNVIICSSSGSKCEQINPHGRKNYLLLQGGLLVCLFLLRPILAGPPSLFPKQHVHGAAGIAGVDLHDSPGGNHQQSRTNQIVGPRNKRKKDHNEKNANDFLSLDPSGKSSAVVD